MVLRSDSTPPKDSNFFLCFSLHFLLPFLFSSPNYFFTFLIYSLLLPLLSLSLSDAFLFVYSISLPSLYFIYLHYFSYFSTPSHHHSHHRTRICYCCTWIKYLDLLWLDLFRRQFCPCDLLPFSIFCTFFFGSVSLIARERCSELHKKKT